MVKVEMVLEPDEADLVLRAAERAREVAAREIQAEKMKRVELAEVQEPVGPTTAEAPEAPKAPAATGPVEAPAATAADVSAETCWPTRANGVVKLAESFLAGNPVSGTGGERFQVMVHLDQEVLGADGDWAATLEDGTHVSAETLRRVACDCGLVAAAQDGEALNVGRRTRSIPPAIRRALMLRDRGCAFPGCTHGAFLHGHHVEHWLHGGETKLANLVMLCTFHHHMVHEGGWKVTADSGGSFVFESPLGWVPALKPPRPVDEEIRNLEPGPGANRPRWDGKHPDYSAAVEELLDAG